MPPSSPAASPPPNPPSLRDLYALLKQGRGREHVRDDNVDELIAMAQQHGDTTLETLLREWQAPCDPDPGAPEGPAVARPPAMDRAPTPRR